MKKQVWTYDEEVYPNLFSAKFKNYKTGERVKFVIYYDPVSKKGHNDIKLLVDFILTRVSRVVGYNNKDYDDRFLNYILLNRERMIAATAERITAETFALSEKIIHLQDKKKVDNLSDEVKKIKQELRAYTNCKFFKSLDLLLMFNTIDRVSLKQMAINMKWPRIEDLPIPPGSIIELKDLDKILSYQDNDVDMTEYLLVKELAKPFSLRQDISKKFNIDVLNANDTDIAKAILFKFYSEATGISWKQLKDKRTYYRTLDLKHCVSPKIKLHTREYRKLYDAIMKAKIDPNKLRDESETESQFTYVIRSKYLEHTVRLGGIHSVNLPEIIEEDDHYMILDIDVSSYYPRIIINDRQYPAHLGPQFIPIYEENIVKPRLVAKKAGLKTEAETLKITANGTFGLMKSPYSWLYDPRVATYICVSGELYLIMLMEAIEMHTKAIVVYSNTDGLTIKLPRNEYHSVMRICSQWQTYTGFELEFVKYKRMIIRDVNNYIMFTYDKEKPMKAKGDCLIKRPVSKGYKYPIIAKAIQDYYDKGIPIEKSVNDCNDIFMFIKAQRINIYKFKAVLKKRKEEAEIELQKNNRWIVTDGNENEGKLVKVDLTNTAKSKEQEMQKDFYVTVINDIPQNSHPDSLKVNYSFYITQAYRMIAKIKKFKRETHNKPPIKQMKLAFG